MARDYIFGFNPTKVPESFERPDHIPEFIHGPRPNIVPSQDNKVISYYEEIIRLKRAMDALQSELEGIIRSQIPDYDISNANNVLSVNEDGTKMEWKPATSASGVSASVEQTETGATITITDASGTTTANVENGEPGFSPSANVQQTTTGATITVTDKSGTTTADILNGKGEKGEPGFSPSASVTQTETGATVTVTDETGTTTAELKNGKDGIGIPGQDGFSPIANVQQTETGATVTVTDKTGTTTANLTNGAPGPTPSVSATATVNDSQGTPSVDVTKTGTDEAPTFNFAFSGLKGETSKGTKGDDGFSPIANVQQTDTGATITVTDKSGTTTATVENGAPGKNGDNGFSPSARVEQKDTGATITITDKSGTTTATVENGPGVPAGGTAGQVLTKVDGTDYNTEWKDPTGGSGTKEVLLHKLSPTMSEIQSILDNNINSIVFIACTLGNDAIPLENDVLCYPSVCYLRSGEKRNTTCYNNTITFNTDGTTQNIISSRGDATIELLPGFYLITDKGNGTAGLRFISSGSYYDYIGNSNYGKDLYVENLDTSLYITFIRETFPYISGGKFKVDYKIPGSGSQSLLRNDILGSEYSSSAYISIVKVM